MATLLTNIPPRLALFVCALPLAGLRFIAAVTLVSVMFVVRVSVNSTIAQQA